MQDYGTATNELFTQFIARILKEIPSSTVAMFSTLKYVNAPNFEKFREHFKSEYKGGFIVHSKAFDGLKGNFPIGFLIWNLNKKLPITKITCDIYTETETETKLITIGEKSFYNLPTYLNKWFKRPKANSEFAIPLSNTLNVYPGIEPLCSWSDNAIGYITSKANDFQNQKSTNIFSGAVNGNGHGIYVNKDNLLQCAVVFCARKIIKSTWINDRDQFLQSQPLWLATRPM
jgi:hypothetical protein